MAIGLILALLLQSPDPLALAREAYELARAAQLEQAEQKLRAAIQIAPDNPLLHSALGGILARLNRHAGSRDAFARALQLAPNNPALRLNLARQHCQLHEWEPAWATLRPLLAPTMDEPTRELALNVALQLGALLARAGRNRAGLALASEAAPLFPNSAPILEMLGQFQRANQLNVDALASYRQALALDPGSPGAALGVAISAAAAGMPGDAQLAFQAASQKFPDNPQVKLAYAVFLLRQAETAAASTAPARALLEELLQSHPQLAEAHYQLGNLHLAEHRLPQALHHLKRALDSGLDDRRIHFALSRAYRRLGDDAAARHHQELFRARDNH